jgi:hypothetical protein
MPPVGFVALALMLMAIAAVFLKRRAPDVAS